LGVWKATTPVTIQGAASNLRQNEANLCLA
jgi:hypothetical protein